MRRPNAADPVSAVRDEGRLRAPLVVLWHRGRRSRDERSSLPWDTRAIASRCHTLRSAALVAAGALVTHRLRYLAGYGDGAEEALAHHGHAYLPLVVGATTVALCLAAAGVLHALARARREGRVEDPPPPFGRLWLRSSAAISVLYALQETLEGLLAPGHAGGLAGVVGDGGWSAFLFATALGAVVALLVRGAGAAVVRAADRPSSPRMTPAPARGWWPRPAAAVGGRPIALHRAGRGPPPLLP